MVGKTLNFLCLLFITSVLLLSACVPIQTNTSSNNSGNYKKLSYKNTTYSDNIKTVQLIKLKNETFFELNNPTIELNTNQSLLLMFDDISEQQQLYQAKIIHLNKDWTSKSDILPMNYIEGYNQFPIQNFEYSFDTKVGYIHYSLKVPEVKVTGNYLLVVYRGTNENDIVLSERFRVFENKVVIDYKIVPSSLVKNRRTHQEVQFDIMLNGANILNRGSDIFPVVRQNNNWLNAVRLNEPRFMDANVLKYNFFDAKLNFPGANEFRFVDISTVNFKGANIASIDKDSTPIKMTTGIDQNRSNQAYREWEDRNGKFLIGNRERQTTELVNDYIEVNFQLKAPQQNDEIFIVGEFNNWDLNEGTRMKYNSSTQLYENSFMMKQGYYEYLYFSKSEPHYALEGSYVDTENEYDIAVYYSNPQLRYDELIGYTQFNSRTARQNK